MVEAIVILLVSPVLLYLFFIFPTQWLKIERIRFPMGLNRKIVQISDLHVEMLRIQPGTLQKILRREKPDYIFLTGDYTCEDQHIPKLAPYFKAISETGAPVYAVLGNHDYILRSLPKLLTLFAQYGITVLRNESVDMGAFQLVGIDDYSSGKSDVDRSFHKAADRSGSLGSHRKVAGRSGANRSIVPAADTRPVIVITHNPNVVPQIDKPFQYLLCGHLHGKQINVPWLFKFNNKGELPAQGIYKGLHRSPNGTFYISKGIGQVGVNARFLVRSEITVHEL